MAPVTKGDQPGDPAVLGARYSGLGKEEPRVPNTGYPVPSEARVASSEPQVASREPRVATSEPRVASSEARVASSEPQAASSEPQAAALLSQQWYWYYVLALLTICYVANVTDRSQVLAASLQAIKREFNATDAQLGILSGLPFAIFYSFLGIPIAAWADRSSRRNVLAWSCALWSAATGACGLALNLAMLL